MSNLFETGTGVDSDFEREQAALIKRAAEKPTLQIINSKDVRPIEDWEESYPGLALFIEVKEEDCSGVYTGRLIATAESSVEFLDLGNEYERRGVVNLTTYGKGLGEEPMFIPTAFLLDTAQSD
jgi:hypothetical protein